MAQMGREREEERPGKTHLDKIIEGLKRRLVKIETERTLLEEGLQGMERLRNEAATPEEEETKRS